MPPDPSVQFPVWMLYFAFWTSLILTVLKVIELISKFLKRSSLEFRLTREVFLRILNDAGECLYAHGVLVSHYGGVLIEDAKVKLKKQNGATKEFPLKIIQFGEKKKTGETGYVFNSTSALLFVPKDKPQNLLYLCHQSNYAFQAIEKYNQFVWALNSLKMESESRIPDLNPEDEDGRLKILSDVIDRKKSLLNDALGKIMDLIQIEPGDYKLTITIHYKPRGTFSQSSGIKTVSSSIKFKIEDNVRDFIRWQIQRALDIIADNILLNKSEHVPQPEYTPKDVEEL